MKTFYVKIFTLLYDMVNCKNIFTYDMVNC